MLLRPPQTFNLSERRGLTAGRRVCGRLWHAVLLTITDRGGNDSLIDRPGKGFSLENGVKFSRNGGKRGGFDGPGPL